MSIFCINKTLHSCWEKLHSHSESLRAGWEQTDEVWILTISIAVSPAQPQHGKVGLIHLTPHPHTYQTALGRTKQANDEWWVGDGPRVTHLSEQSIIMKLGERYHKTLPHTQPYSRVERLSKIQKDEKGQGRVQSSYKAWPPVSFYLPRLSHPGLSH